tara:strand:- start:64 stop:333 length:270 start_codon:yes stop_codon:yes gene_type:complete
MAITEQERKAIKYSRKGGIADAVQTSDVANLSVQGAKIYVGSGGHLKVKIHGGSIVLFKNIPSGTYLEWLEVDKVYRTGTTARDIVAVY